MQKNLTIEDVLSFAEDLSTVSLNAIDGVDQSVTNIEVIQNVMTIASQFYSIDRDVRFLKPEVKRVSYFTDKTNNVVIVIPCL